VKSRAADIQKIGQDSGGPSCGRQVLGPVSKVQTDLRKDSSGWAVGRDIFLNFFVLNKYSLRFIFVIVVNFLFIVNYLYYLKY
jgi:hypothetical protein